MSLSQSAASNVTKCDIRQFPKLVHAILDGVFGRSEPSLESYQEVFGSVDACVEVLDSLQNFAVMCVRQDLTQEQILSNLQTLPERYQKELCDAIWVRRDELRRHLVSATAAISGAHLKDFDWQLRLVMASDKMSNVQQSLVTVNLDLDDGQEGRSVALEMSKDELERTIASLEQAQQALVDAAT